MLVCRRWFTKLLCCPIGIGNEADCGLTPLTLQIYQSFFCRMNDPSYIKDLKMQLLSAVRLLPVLLSRVSRDLCAHGMVVRVLFACRSMITTLCRQCLAGG